MGSTNLKKRKESEKMKRKKKGGDDFFYFILTKDSIYTKNEVVGLAIQYASNSS